VELVLSAGREDDENVAVGVFWEISTRRVAIWLVKGSCHAVEALVCGE